MQRQASSARARGGGRSSDTLRDLQGIEPWFAAKRPDAPLNAINDIVRRGRAGGDTYRVRLVEPRRAQVRLGLDVMDAGTIAPAALYQFARVIAGFPTDYDNDVRCAS